MNNILILGCSFSKWGDRKDDISCNASWPQVLAQKLSEYTVYNAAMYGNSLPFQLLQLRHYLEVIRPIVTIWQLPPLFRYTYFANNIDTVNSVFNKLKFENDSDNYFYLNNWDNILHHSPNFTKNLRNTPKPEHAENMKIHRNFLKKNVSSFNTIFDYAYVNYGRQILKHKNNIVFEHIQKYDKKDVDFCVKEEFADNWENYCCDSGFHFTQEGANAIVNKLIMPRLQQYV